MKLHKSLRRYSVPIMCIAINLSVGCVARFKDLISKYIYRTKLHRTEENAKDVNNITVDVIIRHT